MQQYLPVDGALCKAAFLQFRNGERVIFQFPPKLTNDGRKGDWQEGNKPGEEPIAAFEKSGPREMTLITTYIVDGGTWTTTAIAKQVRLIRGYFARVRERLQQNDLVLLFQLWNFGGAKPISTRLKGVEVKHSDTIVVPCINNIPQSELAYALRTDITMDVRLWTTGTASDIEPPTQNINGQMKQPPEWF